MLSKLINQFLSVFKGKSLFNNKRIKTFGVLFVLGVGLSLAIAACTPSNSTDAPAQKP